ncbi:hypothetical protein [Oceanobacillus rekensis]|nr:hypothetical protein [Oceanobacillus rekensis]
MAKATTRSFVLTIEMETNPAYVRAIKRDLEISRVIYNGDF